MPENWKTYKLKDFGSLKNGVNFSRKDFGNGNPVINVKNLFRGRFVTIEDLPSIIPGTIKNLKDNKLRRNDLLFARSSMVASGTGQVAIVNDLPHKETLFSGFIIRYRINALESLDPQFLNYYLRGPKARRHFESIGTGTTITNLTQQTLGDLEIDIPPITEQKSIASILSALDDKIELNLQMNKTLEEIAMALYKQWFVDFGPFQDGEFVNSELGEIPKGWEVKTVQDFGRVITGKTPSKKFPEHFGEEIPFVTPTDFKNYGKHITTATRGISKSGIEKHTNSILPENSVIVTCIGSDMGKVAINKVRCLTNQQINSLITEHYHYLYPFFKFNYNLLKMLAGDGTTMPIINKTSFQNIKVILPPQNILQEFESQTQEWDEQMHLNSIENQTLTQLRDTLLPKLISGEVRVKDVEKTLSEVL